MRNINEFVRRSGDDARAATGQPPPQPLSTQDIQRSPTWSRTRTSTSTWARTTTSSGAVGQARVRRSRGRPREPRRHPGGLDRVLGRVRERERRPADRGAGARAAAVVADPLAGRRGALGGASATGSGRHGRPGTSRPSARTRCPTTRTRASQQFKDYADCLDKAPSRGHRGATALRRTCCRSRPSSIPQRGGQLAPAPASTAQRSGRSSPSWSGVAPLSSIEPRLSPIVADLDRPPRRVRTGSAGTAASSSRLRSIGLASGPGSWISVGRHALDRVVREVPHAGELEQREPVALGDRAHALEPLAAGLDPALGAEAAVVAARRTRGRAARRRGRGRRSRPRA